MSQTVAEIAERAHVSVEHVNAVRAQLCAESGLTEVAVDAELEWFYNQLGLGEVYFKATDAQTAASHLQSLYASKMLARTSGSHVDLRLESPGDEEGGLYACPDQHEESMQVEVMLEARYPLQALQSYRTGPIDASLPLRTYVVSTPDFVDPRPPLDCVDLDRISCKRLLARIGDTTRGHYTRLLETAAAQLGPAIETLDRPDKGCKQLLICYRRGSTHSYFSAISDALESHGTRSTNKYVAQFSSGFTIYSIYLPGDTDEELLEQLREDASQLYLLPHSSLTPLFREGQLTAQEVAYAYAGWKFAHQFLTRYSDVYAQLSQAFASDPHRRGLLAQLKHRLSKDTFTEDRIFETIVTFPRQIKALYADFETHHGVHAGATPPPQGQGSEPALRTELAKAVTSEIDRQVLETFLTFNHHVLATNFYKTNNVALSFRLDPAFLSPVEYPDNPFGIYFFVGAEFRGFHVRFRDIARGGIRIISSPNAQAYQTNVDRLFNENYDLAHTQQRKNKDIPEGGSKGTILLSPEHTDKATSAFRKYVDSMLDLLMPDPQVVSRLERPEILFLGPDEGTAELMDWAAEHARERGYAYWKAFTTGKTVSLGGIPHDTYGMTTRSVHQFVLGILDKLGIDEASISKTQTGGPDGDLGSNEILISKDRTCTIIDGSGVLHDPAGIDRGELSRLARERKMVKHFDRAKLGDGAFLVLVEQSDITLPDGRIIDSGFAFRNGFHLDPLAGADLFVPCGGRPSSVHINNVDALTDERGRPRFRFIVEGANLFLTQDARLWLEEKGVVVIKDAAANKGGVTSSSLEVLAALALDDETFVEHMTVHESVRPRFYQRYVEQVQARLEQNARAEFECLWREHERTGRSRSLLIDDISGKINELNDMIQTSALWDNVGLRRRVLEQSCPPVLFEQVDLDTLLGRLPENYQQAVIGAYLASHYVYQHGLRANEVSFVAFLEPYLQ
jgi:glutamate dehydrogenase